MTSCDPRTLGFIDVTERKLDNSCLRWEDNLQYWEVLQRIVDAEPIVAPFTPMYGLLASVGIERDRPSLPTRG